MPKRYSGKRKHARKVAEKARLEAIKNSHNVQSNTQENLPRNEEIRRDERSSNGKNLPRARKLRLPSEKNNVAGASDHIDHQFREDMRLRAPLLQQPVSDVNATPSAASVGMVATVQNTLKEVKDKVLENGHNLVQGINSRLGVFHSNTDNNTDNNTNNDTDNNTDNNVDSNNNNDKNASNNEEASSGIGAKVAGWKGTAQEKLLQVKDKIVETGSSIVDKFSKSEHVNNENDKDQPSNEDKNLKESQKPLESNATLPDDVEHKDSTVDFQKPDKDIIEKTFGHKDTQPKDSDSSSVLTSDHVDHKFREEFRSQQPLDVTDQSKSLHAPSNEEQPTEQQSSESSSVSIKDKVSSTLHNITGTVSHIIPKETVNTVLSTAKEQVVNVVHFVQEKANESMRIIEEKKNEKNNEDNNTLKDNLMEKGQDIKERLSSGLNSAVDKVKEIKDDVIQKKDDVTQKKDNENNEKLDNQNNQQNVSSQGLESPKNMQKNLSSQGLDNLNNKESMPAIELDKSKNINNIPAIGLDSLNNKENLQQQQQQQQQQPSDTKNMTESLQQPSQQQQQQQQSDNRNDTQNSLLTQGLSNSNNTTINNRLEPGEISNNNNIIAGEMK